MLSSFLDYHRATVLRKIQRVADFALREPMVPSGTSLLGLVKHLGYVEQWWFRTRFAGEDLQTIWTEADPDADLRVESHETTADIVEFYRGECDRSRSIVASTAELTARARRPGRDDVTLRWIMLHMIQETARHNGHADILREQIDGSTGE